MWHWLRLQPLFSMDTFKFDVSHTIWLSWPKFSSYTVFQSNILRPRVLLPPNVKLTHCYMILWFLQITKQRNNSILQSNVGIQRLLSHLCNGFREVCQCNILCVTDTLVHIRPSVSVTFTTTVQLNSWRLRVPCHTATVMLFTVFISCSGER